MGKYWDWYEVEFERVANRKLSHQRRAEILESLREHVSEATSEFINESRGADEAERLAVKNLGSPKLIVSTELERPRFEWLPVLIAALGMAWMGFFICLSSDVWSMQAILPATVATPALVFLTSLGKRRPKYWALGGATALLGLAMILVICFGRIDMNRAGGMGFMPKWHISSVTENDSRLIQEYEQDRKLITKVSALVQLQDMAQVKELTKSSEIEGSWKVPGVAAFPGKAHTWLHYKDFSEARRLWSKRDVSKLTAPVDDSIRRITANLVAMRDARSYDPKSIWEKNGYSMVGVVLLTYLAVAAAHLLGRFITAIPMWLSRMRWRLAI